jgi:GT2 family glycosyltransferase
MLSVSVVILNWNGWKDTIECLKSLSKIRKNKISLQIIVVDNASTNDSVQKISEFVKKNDQQVNFLENTSNLGFAGGNNVGIKKALEENADYIMVLNNDTLLDEDMVTHLVSFMEDHPEVGAASPKMYFAKGYEYHKDRYTTKDMGNVIWYAGGDIDWNNVYGSNHGVDEIDNGQFEDPTETTFASGACLFLRSSVLTKVGLFDEKYFLYLEDTDLCMKIQRAGYKIYMVPNAKLWHKVSQSSGIGSHLNDYFITRNRLLFGSRYATLRANIALFRESIRFMTSGRVWQKKGAQDFYLRKFGKGSWRTAQ